MEKIIIDLLKERSADKNAMFKEKLFLYAEETHYYWNRKETHVKPFLPPMNQKTALFKPETEIF